MAENTPLLDSHSSTAEKSNLEIIGDNSFTQIKEEPKKKTGKKSISFKYFGYLINMNGLFFVKKFCKIKI
jgi:hypothetical protein